jgi:hypothetical protein
MEPKSWGYCLCFRWEGHWMVKYSEQLDVTEIISCSSRSSVSEEHLMGQTKSKMAVFWIVAPCSLVEVHQRFRGPCYLHHQVDMRHRISI